MKFLSAELVFCVAALVAIDAGWKGNADAWEWQVKGGSWHCLWLLSDLQRKGSCERG